MTAMTRPAEPHTPYNTGENHGELAATVAMPSVLLHALAAAADAYAPLYAQGLVDGYLAATARTAARRHGAGER